MKRRSSAEAGEEAPGVAPRENKKQKRKKTRSKGTAVAEPAASHSMAAEEEEAVKGEVDMEGEGEGGVDLPGGGSDVCQSLMDRYARSSAPHHRHLCAFAAAMRSILIDEGLPLTPPAYFAASIAAVCDADRDALAALSAFVSFLLPHVPVGSVPPRNAREAASSLSDLLRDSTPGTLAAPTVRSLVGSLGLLLQCVDVDDWSAVKLPLKTLLRFSVDSRPKVRKCAQISIEKVFSTFKSNIIIQKASKVLLSLFQSYIPLAVELSSVRDYSKNKNLERSKHIEVLHVLNVVKLIVPNLSRKIITKFLSELYKLFSCQFSLLTRHILKLLEALLSQLTINFLDSEAENMISKLASYISSNEKNPIDSLLSASTLLKDTMNRLHASQSHIWIKHFSLVFSSVSGLLISESSIADHAANILRELINHHTDWHVPLFISNQSSSDSMKSPEASVITSICTSCENVLSACSSIPNQNILAVISDLFIMLGEHSSFFMREIVLKLSLWVTNEDKDLSDVQYVKECLGSALTSMGPDKMLSIIPILLDKEKQTCSNTWLIPIMKKYLVGASLQFFVEHIVPLAKSVWRICNRAQMSSTKKSLLSCVDGLWSLLPAFCHYPTDTAQNFDSLAKILIEQLKEDSSSHEHVSAAMKELVNENKNALRHNQEADNMYQSTDCVENNFGIKSIRSYPYTEKVAHRNIEALVSSSMELFKSLINIFFVSPPEKRAYLQEAIGCLASILDNSNNQDIFASLLVQLGLIDNSGELRKLEDGVQLANNSDLGREVGADKIEGQRCMMLELASAFVDGADKDFINIIFDYIKPYLSATDGDYQCEAYHTLIRILKDNAWFVFAQADELMDLLLGLESPVDLSILRCRFSCLHFLFVHLLKNNGEKRSTKPMLILTEIIRFLKNSREEVRKSAYDTLIEISCGLKNLKPATSQSHYQQLFEMIMGYFSASPPHMMSGAIAALSLLIYKDADLYFYVPNLMPSILFLLQNKAKEVIKAALGLIKVLISCLQTTEIRKLLPDIVNGILPWSSVSKHHFRSKVRTIFEMLIRKCGIGSVLLVVPDKYKGFIKIITQHSQVKASLKGVVHSKQAPELIDSSIGRKHSGLPKWTKREKHHKKEYDSSGMELSKHSVKSGIRQLKKGQKRKFNDNSWLAQKHTRTWEGPHKGQRRKGETGPNCKSKRKRIQGKSTRGTKDMVVG